ncbi:MAG TPA: hypothetical protein VGC66_22830 [Pyrinomonadaceae bacterium]|jgi:hypothetical protein
MSDDIKVAVIAAGTAVVTTLLTIWAQASSTLFQVFLERWKRRAEHLRAMERYVSPLIHATYDLQSRIYNITVNKFIENNLASPKTEHAGYAVENSMFLIAQYFCWWELIRRETQFIDLGRWRKTSALSSSLDELTTIWRDAFRVHPGEQRAIGERMIQKGSRGSQCMGYADFLDALQQGRIPYSHRLEKEIKEIPNRKEKGSLIHLHRALLRVITLLDPKHRRFPKDRIKDIATNSAV